MASNFNPDAYLAGGPSDFDPDEFLKEKPSTLEAGVRGLAQGASFGLADEATGALEAMFTDKSYTQARDESRKAYDEAQKAHPGAYLAGDIGGGVATAFIPGLGFLNAGKGAKLAEVAGKGALQGALGGFGRSDGDAGEQVLDTITGAALGGATGAVASKAGDLLAKMGDKTQDVADRFTIRSLGGTKKQIEKLGGKAGDVAELARTEGISSPFASSQAVADRADEFITGVNNQMRPIYEQSADSSLPTGELLRRIEGKIDEYSLDPGKAEVVRELRRLRKNIAGTGKVGFNPSDLGSYRKDMGEQIRDFTATGATKSAKKDLYGILGDAEMDQIAKVSPELRDANKDLFRKKHLARLLEDMADSGASRSAANNEIGLNSWQAGVMGAAATGEPVSGILSMVGREAIKRYGDQAGGIILDKLAKGMKNPKFAALFEKAAQRGPNAVLALHQALQKNPEYGN
jgi:hypothetical protein